MDKDSQFFEDKSVLEGKLIDFIKLCFEIDRDPCEEIEEAINNAFIETGNEFRITIE